MVKELTRIFPSEAEGLGEFFNDAMVMNPSDSLSTKKYPDISASEYLSGLIKDWRLRRILGSIGTREPYSSLPLLVAMWNLMCREGIWYPIEGMQSFCDRLVKAIMNSKDGRQSKGVGEIRLSTDVIKILVENGKVLGVTLTDGTEISSPSIISNADYKNAFLRLMDANTIPPEWLEAVSAAKQTGSVFQVCLGVDTGKADLSAFKKAGRLIYRKSGRSEKERESLDWNVQEIEPEALAGQELEVSLWGKDMETASSEGKAAIVIRTEAEYSHFARYRLGWRRRSPDYQEYKTRLAQGLIRESNHLIPRIEKAILVMDVATPLTFEDQGGRSEGAVAGWSWDYKDFRDDQPKELIGTPIRGLYMAGYQAFSALFMGGMPTAMESGKQAAKAVLEKTAPIDEIMIPGTN
jgi:phytoene dehydrogenase-like protein